jgi:hypothetical protein
MNRPAPKTMRRYFFVALRHAIHVTWPVLSTILAIQTALGLLIGLVEGWPVGDALYFTFITGLTIGYGDLVPRQALARAPAIGIGVSGLFPILPPHLMGARFGSRSRMSARLWSSMPARHSKYSSARYGAHYQSRQFRT